MGVEVHTENVRAPEGDSEAPGAASAGNDDELDQRLAQLRDDVSNSRVPEARAAIKELEARWPDSKRAQYWAQVLAPPVVVPTSGPDPRSRPRDRERAWLREHGHEYPGCWLAVFEDRLIAADPDLGVVYREARRVLGAEGALLHYQPGVPQIRHALRAIGARLGDVRRDRRRAVDPPGDLLRQRGMAWTDGHRLARLPGANEIWLRHDGGGVLFRGRVDNKVHHPEARSIPAQAPEP